MLKFQSALLILILLNYLSLSKPQAATSTVTLVLIVCESNVISSDKSISAYKRHRASFKRQRIQIITLLKSVLLTWEHSEKTTNELSQTDEALSMLNIIIFSNNRSRFNEISNEVFQWDPKYTNFLTLKFRQVEYTQGFDWMRDKYLPCTSFRLFFPQRLLMTDPTVDKVIYLDTDTLVMRDIRQLWKQFNKFTERSLVGAQRADRNYLVVQRVFEALRHSEKMVESNNIVISPGVLLLNLSNWIYFYNWLPWTKYIQDELRLTNSTDQSAICSYLTQHPEQYFRLNDTWNVSHFSRKLKRRNGKRFLCNEIHEGDTSLLHGNMGSFFKNKHGPLPPLLFKHFAEIDLSSSKFSVPSFVQNLSRKFSMTNQKCRRDKICCRNDVKYSESILHHLLKLK